MIPVLIAYLASCLASREWQNQWFFLFVFSVFLILYRYVKPRVGYAGCALIAYCFLSGLWTWLYRGNRYITVEPYDQMAIRFFAADGVAKLLAVVSVVIFYTRSSEKLLSDGRLLTLILFIANCMSLLVGATIQLINTGKVCAIDNSCGGQLGNPSMSMSFTAAILPVVIGSVSKKYRIPMIVLCMICVALSKSSIAAGVLFVGLLILAVQSRSLIGIALSSAPMVIGAVINYGSFVNDSLRIGMWKMFMQMWASNPGNWLFGTGYGSFGVFSAHIQHSFGDKETGQAMMESFGLVGVNPHSDHWWAWMHNDWLQILFETGVVGLLLSIAVFSLAIINFRRSFLNHELTSLILFGILMTMNYPIHMHMSSLYGAWIITLGLMIGRKENAETYPYPTCPINIGHLRGPEIKF